MLGSFGGPGGMPQNLILALRNKGVKNLEVIACVNFGVITSALKEIPGFKPYISPEILVENGQVRKGYVTWGTGGPGEYSAFEQAVLSGKVEGEILPFGVYVHRVRAAGAGMGAFYSPVGIGTIYARGKESRVINGREYLLEYPMRADFGFVRAYKADKVGNLIYRGTAQVFNPLIAKACDVTIAEVDEIVEIGELDPDQIVTSEIFIDRIVKVPEGG
jgi:3-oxoacid CoA-transferase subunit A